MCPSLKNTFFDSFPKYWKQGFQVLLLLIFGMGMGFGQTVSITATQTSAMEDGSVDGEFTISVTGADVEAIDLLVNLELDGSSTAIEGTDYSAISTAVEVPLISGSGSITLAVVPIDDDLVELQETVIFNIVPDPSYT